MISHSTQAYSVHYKVDLPTPSNHYAKVQMTFEVEKDAVFQVGMPVWTPGSYLVREFSKSVESVSASIDGKRLNVKKSRKNIWDIESKGKGVITVSYLVYCFEFSARTSFINESQALINGASFFMYLKGSEQERGQVEISIPKHWKNHISSMKEKSFDTATNTVVYSFFNYDILVDSPIQLGTFDILEFDVLNVPHYVALVGNNNAKQEQLKNDMKAVCASMAKIVGEFPKDVNPNKYVFIVQHVESGGGGIEHLNSTVLVMPRFNYSSTTKYRSFMNLVAHEYFHLWNVKRIRPVNLGPFDYDEENYTHSLWVAEGITSYYDELAMRRLGWVSPQDFLNTLAKYINYHENRPGSKHATLHEVSFDAWIKEYRPNENTKNNGYSYYTKGFIIAALLDARICEKTNGTKSLDDVFKKLYKDFYGAKKFGPIGTGFTDEEFMKVCNEVAEYDFSEDFKHWLDEPTTPDYQAIIGFNDHITVNNAITDKTDFGVNTKLNNGKTIVDFVHREGTGESIGLNVTDEIISINGYRVENNMLTLYEQLGEPEKLNILISRGGEIKEIMGNYKKLPYHNWTLELSSDTKKDSFWDKKGALQHWLRSDN